MKNCTVRLKTLRTHHLFVRLSNTLHQFGIHLKKQQISQVEQLQRKAARYVFNDYRDRLPGAVTNMIDTLQWDSLACRRTKASLILLHKINEGLVGTNNNAIPIWQAYSWGKNSDKFSPILKIFYKFSFFHTTISVWNSLPQSIALSPNLESFKSSISTLTFEGFPAHL